MSTRAEPAPRSRRAQPGVGPTDAEEYCEHLIEWYDGHGRSNRLWWKSFQSATVGLGAATPLLLLIDGLPRVVEALPAALASVSAAAIAIFGWRENWAAFAHTGEMLKLELLKYRTRTTPLYRRELDEGEALGNFILRIEELVSTETESWRKTLLRDPKEK